MVKRHSYADNPDLWLSYVANQREPKDILLLKNTIQLCEKTPTDLLQRGLHVADILFGLGLDSETLATALIFPAVQQEAISITNAMHVLGENSGKMLNDVLQLQTLGKLQEQKLRDHMQIENLRKMLLAMVSDVRAVLVVLAERLWQLHLAKNIERKNQQQLAQETLDIFAPLANRLGIWQLKWEIEDMCFRYLQPEEYAKVAKWLASRRQEREAYIERIIKIVTDMLSQAHIQDFQMSGRVKHIYSIYRKMQRKGSGLDEIYDISALRVLVHTIDDCYAVLSVLQDAWPHVPKEFDDYISQPKANGYRSIHTVVQGPDNHFVEIQIRTYQMHQESELGMAAHWQYKEGMLQTSTYEAKIALLRQIMAWQVEIVGGTENKKEQALQDLFADRIYVFTPTGDIVELPQGSTPLDFAYHIHSEVGHRCKGAKVDGKLVQLTYALQTGERVEILTSKQANPSQDWLNPHLGYLKTSRARAKAQHWFRIRDSEKNIQSGREMLEKEIKKLAIHEKLDLKAIAENFNYKTGDDLLAALALGDIRLAQIIHHVRPVTPAPVHSIIKIKPALPKDIQILGVNNLLTQNARCCKPLPGDAIIGYITRSRGVSIHRRSCKNILQISEENKDRLIEVNWGDKNQLISESYPVDLLLHVQDKAGVLRDVTTVLAGEKINVLGLQTQKSLSATEADIFLTIEISSREQLHRALQLLQRVPNILEARRR